MDIFKPKRDFFALSFSDDRLRLALAGKKGQLRTYVEQELPPGIIKRGVIKSKENLGAVVANLLKAAKVKQKFVVVGLPEIKAFARVLTLPLLPLEELGDAVRWELESLLPFSVEKACFDWMVLGRLKSKVRVSVVALPQDLVESYARLLEELGFQPVAFEIDSLSLARLVGKSETATMVVEVKKKEAVLAIVGPSGGVEVSSTVALDGEGGGAEEFFSTLQNLLGFFAKKQKKKEGEQKVGKVLVCGEGANENWVKAVAEKAGLPSEMLKVGQPNLASVASLAGKEVAAPIDEETINLIPLRIQGLYDQATRVREISTWLKFALFCLLLVFFGYGTAAARTYFELKRIEGGIIELQAAMAPESVKIEQRAQQLNARAQKIASLADSRSEVVSLLSLIGNMNPRRVEVRHCFFDHGQGRIFINGTAEHRDDLLTFRDDLEKTDRFSEIHIPLSSLGREEDVDFSISVVGGKKDS